MIEVIIELTRSITSPPPPRLAALQAQIDSDCAWLRALRIMDYSLLAMLHFPARAQVRASMDADECSI